MNERLKKLSGLNVLTKKELKNVFAGTGSADCEDGYVPDGNGGCVPERTDGQRNADRSSRCDTA